MNTIQGHTFGIIISAEKSTNSEKENFAATEELLDCLIDYCIPHKEVETIYNGITERSVYCTIDNEHQRQTVLGLAADFNQEFAVIRDPSTNSCILVNPQTQKVIDSLGTWSEVSKIAAEQQNHVYDSTSGFYYIIKKGH